MDDGEIRTFSFFGKSSVVNIAFSLASKLISFIYVIFLSRLIPPEDVGLFYLGVAVVSIFSLFSDLGTNVSLTRYLPYLKKRKEHSKLIFGVGITFFLSTLVSLFLSIIVFFYAYDISTFINKPELSPFLRLLSVYVFISRIFDVTTSFLLSTKQIFAYSFLPFIRSILRVGTLLLFVHMFGGNAISPILSEIVSYSIVLFVLVIYVSGLLVRLYKSIPTCQRITGRGREELFRFGKEYINFGIFSMGIVALVLTLGYIDRVMLSIFGISNKDIGVYSLVFNLVFLLSIIPNSLTNVQLPIVSELFGSGNISEVRRISVFSTKFVSILLLPILITLILISSDIISLVYGNAYLSGVFAFVVLLLGFFVRFIIKPAGTSIVAMRRLDIDFRILLFATIVNIILNAILIPYFGINGAAVGTALSSAFVFLGIFHYAKRFFNYHLPYGFYKIVFASLITFFVAYVLFVLFLPPLKNIASSLYLGASKGQSIDILLSKFLTLSVYIFFGGLVALCFFIFLILLKTFNKSEYIFLSELLKRIRIPLYIRNAILSIFKFGVME